ncbi:NADPH-dependent FMN reductase [Amycolatopsis sp. NBC_01480]|uniref:NADPH-dependent FMN reductase n=1 Tax=Amycolatopsis sp. NBC_01480 TaxID=2903562 RepID=UPI002E2DAAD5|nr:NAD(P)H-dependent oxidoreductase [Amycolatopsis sp. NBC_01480]
MNREKNQMTSRLLAIGGSLAARSLTSALLQQACAIAEEFGASTECLAVTRLQLDMFAPDTTTASDPRVARLLSAVSAADVVFLASPLYGGTPSGAVKNILDTLHLGKDGSIGPLSRKRCAVATVGGGALNGSYSFQRGGTGTLDIACKNLGAWVDPRHLEFSELHFDTDSNLHDAVSRDQLRSGVRRLLAVTLARAEVVSR